MTKEVEDKEETKASEKEVHHQDSKTTKKMLTKKKPSDHPYRMDYQGISREEAIKLARKNARLPNWQIGKRTVELPQVNLLQDPKNILENAKKH